MAISESKKPLESQQFHMIQPNMCNSTCIISILIFTLHIFSILPWNYKLLKNKNFNPDWCFIYSYSSLPGLAPSAGRLGRVQFGTTIKDTAQNLLSSNICPHFSLVSQDRHPEGESLGHWLCLLILFMIHITRLLSGKVVATLFPLPGCGQSGLTPLLSM